MKTLLLLLALSIIAVTWIAALKAQDENQFLYSRFVAAQEIRERPKRTTATPTYTVTPGSRATATVTPDPRFTPTVTPTPSRA